MLRAIKKKAQEVAESLEDLQAIALQPLTVPIEKQGAGFNWTSLDDMQSAYVTHLKQIVGIAEQNQVDYNSAQKRAKFPSDFADLLVASNGTRGYTVKLLWEGKDGRTVLEGCKDMRLRALWRPRAGRPSDSDALCLAATQNNIDILGRCLLFFLNHKGQRLEAYKKAHPEVPFQTLQLRLSMWECDAPAAQSPSPYQKMVDAVSYRKGQLAGQTAETMIFIATPPDENGEMRIHDPVTCEVIASNSVSESDIVLCATERFFSRIYFVLNTITKVYNKEQIKKSSDRLGQADETMANMVNQLVQAQLDDSAEDLGGEQKPERKRRRDDQDD